MLCAADTEMFYTIETNRFFSVKLIAGTKLLIVTE